MPKVPNISDIIFSLFTHLLNKASCKNFRERWEERDKWGTGGREGEKGWLSTSEMNYIRKSSVRLHYLHANPGNIIDWQLAVSNVLYS